MDTVMVNETAYQYLWTMEKPEEQALFDKLAKQGAERVAHKAALDAMSERDRESAKDALRQGMRPSRVAKALQYTDGYVRKLRDEADLPPDPRYVNVVPPSRPRKSESENRNPGPEPIPVPALSSTSPFLSVDSRIGDLLQLAASLTPAEQAQAAERIRVRYATWLHGLRRKPATDTELIEAACRANVPNYSDLRP